MASTTTTTVGAAVALPHLQGRGGSATATPTVAVLRSLTLAALMFLAAVSSASAADPNAVVATVGSDPVRAGELQRLVAKATRGKKVDSDSLRFLQAQALEEIIARRLVLAYARRMGEMPAEDELAVERAALKARLVARRRSIEDFLKAESLRESDLDRQIAWNVLWRKYVARYATDQRLASYFAAHHREYDGTQLLVSHILLRPSADGAKTTVELLKQAEKIREEIVGGTLSFADAARKYSAGPSRRDGGRLGLIGRHGPQDETFSRAAFALDAGQVSQPVKTSFGAHLIRCDEIKPGDKKLADVRKELEDALSQELLDKLAQAQRQYTPVEYTGILPHFKPETHELEPAGKQHAVGQDGRGG
ncbi:MAG: peptidylprolyl isomerase [Thermoguttaceae bacterium]